MPVIVHEKTIVRVGASGIAGPPGPPGEAIAATGVTPPAPATDGQIWRDPASGRVAIFFAGTWRDAVLDGQHF